VKRLIIGCGNPDRGDDAAGLLAVRRLRELGCEAVEYTGEGTGLLDFFEGAAEVVLVDAAVTGAAPGAIHVWDSAEALPEWAALGASSHHFGIAQGLRLAAALGCLPEKLVIYGIEGRSFGIGEAPSPEVIRAVEEVARRIASGHAASGGPCGR
jgi:hydrogenase maturation protease